MKTKKATPPKRPSRQRCEACGKPWTEHGGIAVTCAEVTRLRDIIRRARRTFATVGKDAKICADMFLILGEAEPCPVAKAASGKARRR
jgi:hypothetical protein